MRMFFLPYIKAILISNRKLLIVLREKRHERTNNDKIHLMEINGTLVTLKVTLFESAFASRTSSNISQGSIQYLPCIHRTYNPPRSQRGSRESRIAARMCALAHRHASQVPRALCAGRMSGTRRVEGPFTIYTAETHGVFPSVSRSSPTHPSWVAFAKSSSEMVDALVERACRRGEG